MESLLCDEVWLSSPDSTDSISENFVGSFYTSQEDSEHAVIVCLEKELSYVPRPGYVEQLHSKSLIAARFRAIQWLIKSRSRLNLSFGTVFNAVNYLDRFISTNQCCDWKYWMVELLSVACLSIAWKYSEMCTYSLQEIQMEDLDYCFQSVTIQQMELILLQTLEWRLSPTTTYSCMELLIPSIDSLQSHLQVELTIRVTELLLGAILDVELMEYRPSIVGVSAIWCSLEELIPSKSDACLEYVGKLLNQEQKDDLVKCHNTMQAKLVNSMGCGGYSCYRPSSPVTVMLTKKIDVYDCHIDLSQFKLPNSCTRKRKREEQ